MTEAERFRGGLAVFILQIGMLFQFADAPAGPTRFDLLGTFNLAAPRAPGTRHYLQETRLLHIGLDGKPTGTETIRMKLEWMHTSSSGGGGDVFRCGKFTMRKNQDAEVSLPALEGWRYELRQTSSGLDDKGQVFGIDHAKFLDLKDSGGNGLQPVTAYQVYNSFIDFHSFTGVFAMPAEGGGIQDLKKIGDRIVHAAAFTEPPVNLGNLILPGSTFKNGEVTLEFKGLTGIQGVPCALIGFDSGESSFRMLMRPMPDMEIQAVGRSHYAGDLALELETRWVGQVIMSETVITQVNLPAPQSQIHELIERNTKISTITADEFERD